jgi:hypothetical protein
MMRVPALLDSQLQRLKPHLGKLAAATLFAAGAVTTYYITAPDVGSTGARIEAHSLYLTARKG